MQNDILTIFFVLSLAVAEVIHFNLTFTGDEVGSREVGVLDGIFAGVFDDAPEFILNTDDGTISDINDNVFYKADELGIHGGFDSSDSKWGLDGDYLTWNGSPSFYLCGTDDHLQITIPYNIQIVNRQCPAIKLVIKRVVENNDGTNTTPGGDSNQSPGGDSNENINPPSLGGNNASNNTVTTIEGRAGIVEGHTELTAIVLAFLALLV
ncbi:uncharacterized protein J8A68_004854 [[Candida] subhashii]|uniref:Uncharacterized protein n=1 Tax=[Candida] subhashii TaxID=561895 RepID=A0A8J5QEG6_9ASCO|nr:uncharacterized protein J8A68_004854 [[Candida] subhashii]KAG7661587.1 hypothetical protein J8A68_004854 [[Candida] subhashii]